MKSRNRRLLSVFLAASMLMGHGNMAVLAEETVETVEESTVEAAEAPVTEAPTEAPTEPPTEPPTEAPVTEASVTEAPVTEAPVTEAPSTEAPVTEGNLIETEVPVTEAPVTEAPVTEAPATEAPTTETEAATEKVTETEETETESTKTQFTWSGGGLSVKVKLSKKDALVESAQMTVKELTKASGEDRWKAAKKLVEKETNRGHRELSDVRFYEISFMAGGQQVTPSEKMEVTFTYEKALSLGLSEYAQAEAKSFALTKKAAKELTEISLDDNQKVKSVKVVIEDSLLIGFAGIQNRENDGSIITKSGLKEGLGDALDYAVLAGEYDGNRKENVLTKKQSEDSEDSDEVSVSDILDALSAYSLILADGKSSDSVQVINLYTEKDGTLNTEPLEAVLDEGSLDVSDTVLVVNLVAGDEYQALAIPVYDAKYQDDLVEGELSSYAGRLVYNVVAEQNGEFVPYLGAASLEGAATGTYLAPEASLTADFGLLGAIYADKVAAVNVQKAVVGMDGQKEPEEVTEPEAVTELETTTEPEAVTELETATESEVATGTETTAEPKIVTESETATEPEAVTELETTTELETAAELETATEPETSTELEAVTEPGTSAGAEIATESATEAEPVTETEMALETETVTETETAAETENLSETSVTEASEENTEAVSENETEAVTEEGTEAISEESTETESEQELIQETELESETELMMLGEEIGLAAMALAANGSSTVNSLPVKVITYLKDPGASVGTETPVAGAVLEIRAAESIIPAADVKVKNQEGKEVSYAAGSVAYAKDAVIYSWTTDEAGTAVDISPYLIAGGSYILREITPSGYMKGIDISFSIDAKGAALDANGNALRTLNVVNYPEAAQGEGQQASTASLKLAVREKTTDPLAAPVYLGGAEFVITDETGVPLKDASGNPYTFSSEAREMTLNLDPEIYEDLTKDLPANEIRTFRLAQIKAAAGYQISEYSEVMITIRKGEDGKVTLIPETEKTVDDVVIFYNEKVPEKATGSISVTKRNYLGNTDYEIYSKTGGTYYAALFADAERENRISDVMAIEIKTGYKSANVLFENLANGTYYVGETDRYGNPVGEVADETLATDPFYAEYIYGGSRKQVVIKVEDDAAFDADPEKVTIQNRYFKMPEDFLYTASFQVTNIVKNADGTPLNSNSTFYAGIYTKNSEKGKYTYIGKKAIKMGGKAEKTITVELTMSTETKYVQVKMVDANGKEVASGTTYNITVTPSEIVLKQGETKSQTVTVTNVRVSGNEPESETSADPNNLQAELKLTKKVVYKDTPVRVNSVYYIGIFDDAGLTKLRYKKAMNFTNASELTATLKVNLHKLASREVTFYFAEVDEEGKVLKGGNEFGYDIALNKTSTTLNASNLADEVIVTNTVITGGSVEQNLTDPTSGLAGDSGALTTAQNLAAGENSSENTKTGDDNPILQLIIVLIVSIVVIVGIVIVMIVRRNQRKKNRRDRR